MGKSDGFVYLLILGEEGYFLAVGLPVLHLEVQPKGHSYGNED